MKGQTKTEMKDEEGRREEEAGRRGDDRGG